MATGWKRAPRSTPSRADYILRALSTHERERVAPVLLDYLEFRQRRVPHAAKDCELGHAVRRLRRRRQSSNG